MQHDASLLVQFESRCVWSRTWRRVAHHAGVKIVENLNYVVTRMA